MKVTFMWSLFYPTVAFTTCPSAGIPTTIPVPVPVPIPVPVPMPSPLMPTPAVTAKTLLSLDGPESSYGSVGGSGYGNSGYGNSGYGNSGHGYNWADATYCNVLPQDKACRNFDKTKLKDDAKQVRDYCDDANFKTSDWCTKFVISADFCKRYPGNKFCKEQVGKFHDKVLVAVTFCKHNENDEGCTVGCPAATTQPPCVWPEYAMEKKDVWFRQVETYCTSEMSKNPTKKDAFCGNDINKSPFPDAADVQKGSDFCLFYPGNPLCVAAFSPHTPADESEENWKGAFKCKSDGSLEICKRGCSGDDFRKGDAPCEKTPR